MYVGESPKYVAAVFSLAEKLSSYSPVILFIDEIDILLGYVLKQLLTFQISMHY